MILFKQVFTADPKALQLFPFKDDPNPYQNAELRVLSLNVTQKIGEVVTDMKNFENHIPALKNYGKKLLQFGVKQENYPVAAKAFMNMLGMGLQAQFTEEIESAWQKTVKICSESMISNNYVLHSVADHNVE